MQNPNKKGVFISKLDDKPFYNLGIEISEITPLGQFDPPLQGGTNDIMMAGIMMTEDVKRQIIARFGEIPRGMLYLWGEELGFLSPVFAGKTENYEIWAKQLDVLCDMKDTLQ
jgi:hypothetical protein